MEGNKNRYKCLKCGHEATTFLDDCPCGDSPGYKNLATVDVADETSVHDEAIDTWARYTSRFNPYVPT